MNIVLFAPSGTVASYLSRLGSDTTRDHVTVVTRDAPDSLEGHATIVLRPKFAAVTGRMEKELSGSVVGRNALRLSPLDPGRRFAGAARRNAELRELVESADLIAVLERDGILAGWWMARHRAPKCAHAVFGFPAAHAILSTTRG